MFRWLLLAVIAIGLFLLGQFDEEVFAFLARLWTNALTHSGAAGQHLLQSGTRQQLTGHGLPVALTYRLLFLGLSILWLRILLRRRYQREIVGGFAGLFLISSLLIGLGQLAHVSPATQAGHQLMDFLCSPLAMLMAYPLLMLLERERRRQEAGADISEPPLRSGEPG